jgi:hypothetical protein
MALDNLVDPLAYFSCMLVESRLTWSLKKQASKALHVEAFL